MTDLVDTVVEDARWEAAGVGDLAGRACGGVLAELGLEAGAFEICVLACDDARIKALNADFRDREAATNVLSWPADELGAPIPGAPPSMPAPGLPGARAPLGDIAIAWETCAREAAAQGKPFADHCLHLLAHGCLHLLGYDHISEKDASLMEGLERRVLANLGVADPYDV